MDSARTLLFVTGLLAGLGELGMTIQFATSDGDDAPGVAAAFGVVFLVFAWLARAGKNWSVIGLAVMFGIEIAFAPFYPRSTWVDWAEQGGFVAVSAIGLVAALAVLTGRTRLAPTAGAVRMR
jgi:hypothetical protein